MLLPNPQPLRGTTHRRMSLQSNFQSCLAFTLCSEGGYANVPGDDGGPTKYGITIGTLSAFLGRHCAVADIEELDPAVAGVIYQRNYWLPMLCQRLPCGLDLMVFDFGVNAGPTTSVRMLQKVLGCVQDGNIGQKTLGALAAKPPALLIYQLAVAQESYYHSLADFNEFGAGWLARVAKRREAAMAMAKPQTVVEAGPTPLLGM